MARPTLDTRLQEYPILERVLHRLIDRIDQRDWTGAIQVIYKLNLYIFYTSKKKDKM